MNSASLYSLAGRYDNPIPPRFLAPIDFLKIPGYITIYFGGGGNGVSEFLTSLALFQGWAKLVLIALERYSVALKRLTSNLR